MALPHARSPMKGRLLQTPTQVDATPTSAGTVLSPVAASTATKDGQFMGADITVGPTLIGQVEGLARDPISQRVRRLITSYGPGKRRVGVPIEGVVKRSAERLVLGVGVRSLDDLPDWTST